MTKYQFALLLHLLALMAATAASGIVHFAAGRRAATRSLRTALEWGTVIGTASRVFPIAVLTLVATGGFMVAGRWSWHSGWIIAGVTGAVTLFVSGAVIGARGAAAAQASIRRLQAAGRDLPNDAPPDRVARLLSESNTGIALAIVVVMTLKTGLLASLAALVIGAAVGASRARSHPARQPALMDSAEIEIA